MGKFKQISAPYGGETGGVQPVIPIAEPRSWSDRTVWQGSIGTSWQEPQAIADALEKGLTLSVEIHNQSDSNASGGPTTMNIWGVFVPVGTSLPAGAATLQANAAYRSFVIAPGQTLLEFPGDGYSLWLASSGPSGCAARVTVNMA